MNLIISVFPIVLLIYLMTRKKSMPSHKALPLVAVLMYLLKLGYFNADPNMINATVIKGFLEAWTPILIIWGAIMLFRTMELSGAMMVIRSWLNSVSENKVAQLMIVGWAFAFLIEGASGFGTPAAIAAPILVGLGFPPVRVAMLCLIMNSVPVSMGAVGTPTEFGFKALGLSEAEMLEVGFKSVFIHGIAALIIPIVALRFVVAMKEIRANIVFIFLSILSCVVPYIIIAKFNYQFPAILGGLIGLMISAFLAKAGVGLAVVEQTGKRRKKRVSPPLGTLIGAFFPLWSTVLLLVITRIPQLGIKGLLTAAKPAASAEIGTLGQFSISPALVINIESIIQADVNWGMKLLYVPALIPFFLICFISFFVLKMNRSTIHSVLHSSAAQIKNPMLALIGALIFVYLIRAGGDDSCANIIGKALSDSCGKYWQYGASFLGAIGSFFSGSNTVSNVTFGSIQDSIATNLNLNRTTILALQSVGGAMGNMVCINNIVAVCSVLGLAGMEGYILKRTVIPMIIYGLIAAAMSMLL